MKVLLGFYQSFIKKYPVLSSAIQTSTLMAIGDLLAQTVAEEQQFDKVNFKRSVQFASVGFILVGPILAKWYKFLSSYVGEGTKTAGFKKMFLDQCCFTPCFLYIFLNSVNIIQGYSFDRAREFANRDYLDILMNNYRIWPAIQILNFCFVPLEYQVVLVQTVAVFWNAYISWKTQQKVEVG